MKYAIVIEKSRNGYGAYVPDLAGIGVVGDTAREVERLVREAIDIYLDDCKARGQPLPKPKARCKYVESHAGRAA